MKKMFSLIVKDSWFHAVFLVILLIYTLFWPSGIDKTVAIIFMSFVLLTLIIGKYLYFKDVP
jgi:hypothetical protein